jgi:hypothetical protein
MLYFPQIILGGKTMPTDKKPKKILRKDVRKATFLLNHEVWKLITFGAMEANQTKSRYVMDLLVTHPRLEHKLSEIDYELGVTMSEEQSFMAQRRLENKDSVAVCLQENPTKEFKLTELKAETGLSTKTISMVLHDLHAEGLVDLDYRGKGGALYAKWKEV